MVRSITSKDTNCKYEMLECKGEAKRQPGFSRGIGSLATTTNPRCGTQVTKTRVAATSQVTKTRALTRSLRSPSPAWWSSNHEQGHQDLLRASTITTASSEGPRSPRPSRCCQSPRVTSPSLHLSRIEHQERMHQLNLLAST